MWQSAESHLFRQLNFSNIRREKIIEALLQRFKDNYPGNLTYRGVRVFAGQKRPQTGFVCFLHRIDLMHVAERQDYHLIDDLSFS